MKKTVYTGFVNFNVTGDRCNTKNMIEAGYISDGMKVNGLCRKNHLWDYTLAFNSDYDITTEIILHEVYHLFFEVLNDIGRNDTYSAEEIGKDLYCYMFVDMFSKAMKIVRKELKARRKNNGKHLHKGT